MTSFYENVKIVGGYPKQRHKRRRRRRARYLSSTTALSFVTCVLILIAVTMCARAFWCAPADDQQLPVQTQAPAQHPVQSQQPPELVPEKADAGERYVLYDVRLSEELQHYTQDVCEEYGVNYPLVTSIMKKESEFLPDVISVTDDYGIMQINAGNHEWLEGVLGITDWFDPRQNILAGVYVLSQFNGYEDVHQILMSYNCGPSGAKKLWAEGIYSTAYSRAVVEILDGLEVIDSTENP